MKRVWLAALFAALACGSFASKVRADEEMGEKHHEMHWDKMKADLGLSDEQVKKLKDSHKSMEEAMKPIHEKSHADMKKLKEQVDAKASDKDIQSTLDDLKKNHEEMEKQEEKHHDDMSSILTPTQHAKMMLAMHEKHEMGEHHHGKGEKGKEKKGKEEKKTEEAPK
jgi:Spy/CpxP family protein refolding chaperone